MAHRSTRLASQLVIAVLAISAGFIFMPNQPKAAAACSALPSDKGTVTQNVSLSAGVYTIWSRVKTATPANNSYYMNIDNSAGNNLLCGATMGGTTLQANTWTWVKYASTVTVTSSTAGNYSMVMAGKDDNVEVDRVILTGDSSCVPDNNAVSIGGTNYYGENCASSDTTTPVVTISAPTNNATISGSSTTVTGNVTDSGVITSISAYIDGSSSAAASDTSPSSGAYSIALNVAGLSVGTHSLVVKATDAGGNTGASSVVSFTIPDTTAPTISSVIAGSVTQTSATVTWVTNEASDSQVEYGTTTAYGSSTTLAASKITSHSVTVSGLTAGTTYHYRVKSKDATGNLATSGDASFTTTAPTTDTTPPTVALTTPTSNATVNGTVTLSATAADASGIAGVQFQVNGANLNNEDTTAPYTTSWNTSGLTNGTYALKAIARDNAGNTSSSTVSVTVSNTQYLPEDINQSGHVDVVDLAIVIGSFNKTSSQLANPRADVDGSGKVDIVDLARVLGKYNQ